MGFTLGETLGEETQPASTFVKELIEGVKIMERTTLLIVVLVAALSLVEARKFCPKERNGDKCKAKKASYKCGVFFKDLSPKVPLAWLRAIKKLHSYQHYQHYYKYCLPRSPLPG